MLNIDDINKIIGYKINMITYDDLDKINNIEELFNKDLGNACLILVRNAPRSGHWIILVKNNRDITFFDSYGGFIDDQLDYTPVKYYPKLSKLLLKYLNKNPKRVHYNDYQLQQLKEGVSTCGRWCALYCKFRDIDIDDFVNIMKKYKKEVNLDYLVTLLTE